MKKFLFLPVLALVAIQVQADGFFGEVETTSKAASDRDDSAWSQRGWLQQKTGYGYRTPAPGFNRNDKDFTRTETQLYGELDWRRDNWRLRLAGSFIHDWLPELEASGAWSGYEFTDEQRDARELRWEAADSYLSWQSGNWWLKGGYQTLAWGESETLKVTDVLARRDQRWPGQEDLEDLRLPVPALTLTWDNRLDLVVLPEMPTDRLPGAFEEFDPYIQLRGPMPDESPAIETRSGKSPGWALRWRNRQPGLDTQFMLADVYSFDTTPIDFELTPEPQPRLQGIVLEPWRQQIVGASVHSVHGNWLLKTEQAWHRGVHLAQEDLLAPWAEHDQWRGMVVVEFSGINRLTVTGEFSWNYTHDHNTDLATDEWQTGQALRVSYTLFNERLNLGALGVRLPGDEGELLRLSADWDLSDDVNLGVTLVEYNADDQEQILFLYRRNDTVLVNLRWGF